MSRDEEPPNGPSATPYPDLGDKIGKVKVAGPRPMIFGHVYPVSRACPNCGGKGYTRVESATLISFTDDRVCEQCGMRYTPPMPRWGGVAFCALGVAGSLGMVYVAAWYYHHGVGNGPLNLHLLAWGVLAYAAGLCVTSSSILYGIWLIRRGPRTSLPPAEAVAEWSAPSPPPVAEGKMGTGSERIAPAGPYSESEPPKRRGAHDDDAEDDPRIHS